MEKVPDIISTKDLSYIEDIFNWNFTAAKKALSDANCVQEGSISKTLYEVYNLHYSICKKLIKLLNQGGQNGNK